MFESHTQLMQISYYVSGGVKTWHCCSLMVVNHEISRVRAQRSQLRGQVGASRAAERGINSIEFMIGSALGHDADLTSCRKFDLPWLGEFRHFGVGESPACIATSRGFADHKKRNMRG